jgi:hypothetical protein
MEAEPKEWDITGSGRTLLSGTVDDSACLSVRGEQEASTQWNVQSRLSEFASPQLHPQDNGGGSNQADDSHSPLSVSHSCKGVLLDHIEFHKWLND